MNIDKLCLAHTNETNVEDLLVDAKSKIQEIIDTRLRKDKRMLDTFKVTLCLHKVGWQDLHIRLFVWKDVWEKIQKQSFFYIIVL